MNKISKKYRKKFAIFILVEFFTFSMFGVFHIHKYNLNEISSFAQKSNLPYTTSDLSSDFLSFCSIHQFNQSVLNYDNSNIDFLKITNLANLNCPDLNNDYILLLSSNLIPRAPPV